MDTFVDSLSSTTETLSQSSACFTQDLSAVYWQDPVHSTLQNLLSSLKQVNADIAAAREEIPTDPYERLKYEYGCLSAEPFDFDSIEVPEDFCMKKAHQGLLDISKKHSDNFNNHIEVASLSSFNSIEHPQFGNAFAAHSNEGFQVDRDKITKHFQFLDMVRSVPLEYIKANPREFNRKVLAKFIEIHQ